MAIRGKLKGRMGQELQAKKPEQKNLNKNKGNGTCMKL